MTPGPEPRLKTHIRVAAQLRRAQGAGAFATVARRGDPDAGAVAVKLYLGGRTARLFIQSRDLDGNAVWREPFETETDEPAIDAWLEKETRIDPDLWVVEIEDKEGRTFLD
ncbi:MAG: DUF1491 family protein [Hyphococcus sp.]